MPWQAGVVALVILVAFVLLFLEKGPPDQIMLAALCVVWSLGIVESHEAIAGFGSTSPVTIGALFIVVHGVDKSKVLNRGAQQVLGKQTGEWFARVKLCLVGFGLSGFLNNTPLVALLLPIVRDWARSRKFAASKFLMPLSFSTIMGGLTTTIGTSTNLLVQDLMAHQGMEPFSFFEPSKVSLPVGIVALSYLLIVGYRCLPDNRGGMFRDVREKSEQLVTQLELQADFPLCGQTVFRVLEKLSIPREALLGLLRPAKAAGAIPTDGGTSEENQQEEDEESSDGEDGDGDAEAHLSFRLGAQDSLPSQGTRKDLVRISPVPEYETAQAGDILVLSVNQEELVGFFQRSKYTKGLQVQNLPAADLLGASLEFVELMLAPRAPLVGKRLDKGREFVAKCYQSACLVAYRKRGAGTESLQLAAAGLAASGDESSSDEGGFFSGLQSPASVALGMASGQHFAAGDTMLVLAPVGTEFPRGDFFLVTRIGSLPKPPQFFDYLPLPLFGAGLVLAATGLVPIVQVAVTLSVIFVLGGWVQPREIREVVDWHLLILIGSALGLSKAVSNSGLSAAVANLIKAAGLPPHGALALMFLFTLLMTELITNNAAAALGLPLAVDLSRSLGLASAKPFAMTVMLAASTSYAIPIGYATNLMVMGPGGYTFCDFLKVGTIMDLIYLVGCSLLVPLWWPLTLANQTALPATAAAATAAAAAAGATAVLGPFDDAMQANLTGLPQL